MHCTHTGTHTQNSMHAARFYGQFVTQNECVIGVIRLNGLGRWGTNKAALCIRFYWILIKLVSHRLSFTCIFVVFVVVDLLPISFFSYYCCLSKLCGSIIYFFLSNLSRCAPISISIVAHNLYVHIHFGMANAFNMAILSQNLCRWRENISTNSTKNKYCC